MLHTGFISQHTNNDFFDDFLKISDNLPKISEDSPKVIQTGQTIVSDIFRKFPKLF